MDCWPWREREQEKVTGENQKGKQKVKNTKLTKGQCDQKWRFIAKLAILTY